MTRPTLDLIHGSGTIIEALETTLAAAKRGEIDALVIVGAYTDSPNLGWAWGMVPGCPFPYARLQAGVDTVQHLLVSEGLEGLN